MSDSPRADSADTPIDRMRATFARAVQTTSMPLADAGPSHARAAQIALVAQAEDTHRIADALERIAAVLEEAHA